jgi:hypothetical protein
MLPCPGQLSPQMDTRSRSAGFGRTVEVPNDIELADVLDKCRACGSVMIPEVSCIQGLNLLG